jgi:hypothetical protein
MPPITGTFLADFSSFYTAVQKANVSLNGLEENSSKVQSSLNRMANEFQGQKIIQQATLAVEAVNRIGGATALTEKEQAKLNAVVTEAIAKYKALGATAPTALTDMAAATTKATGGWSAMLGPLKSASGLLTGLGISFGISTIVSFGKELLDTADHLQKLADQTGLTLSEVQKLEYIAGQTSTTVDAMTNAISKLQEGFGSGDQGLVAAVEKLGFNFYDLKQATPFDQMLQLGGAIAKIKDPTEQAAAAAAIFGKSWKEIMPALKADMQELADAAPKMSDEAVQAFESMGDAFSHFYTGFKSGIGEMVFFLTDVATKAFKTFQDAYREAFSPAEMERAERWANVVGLSVKGLLGDLEQLSMAFRNIKPPAVSAPQGYGAPDLSGMPTGLGSGAELLKNAKAVTDELNKQILAQTQVDAAVAATTARVQTLATALSGQGTLNAATEMVAAVGQIGGAAKLATTDLERVNSVMAAGVEAATRLGTTAPKAMTDLYWETVKVPPVIDGIGTSLDSLGAKVAHGGQQFAELAQAAQDAATKEVEAFNKAQWALNDAAAATEDVTSKTQQHAAAVQKTAESYQLLTRSAAEFAARAAQAELDAQTNLRRGGVAATMGFFQSQQAASYRQQAGAAAYRENQIAAATGGGAQWGGARGWAAPTETNLNVNVNNATAQDLANKLVTELRHSGVRLG